MNAVTWARARELLAEAAERPEADRERYVVDHCADPELRREILTMLGSPAPLSEIVAAGALTPGAVVGPYRIEVLLGWGGMGEVYRAHDSRLDREVAIKVLPARFAQDRARLERFEREAKVLAAINHPNIAHIYGLEESTGVRALVMELVEGDTLADRLIRGPLPMNEGLAIAKQIAEALEAAHEHGVIHRDLKPANIKVRHDGTVKVLDFGLAKVTAWEQGGDHTSPTSVTAGGTFEGLILGTAAYMSPEQARGQAVDKRADIWAFGVVLYEMLTGRRAFDGQDISVTLASVLTTDPDWRLLPTATPASLRRLLMRCLTKDPRHRLQAIGDARLEIDELQLEHVISEGLEKDRHFRPHDPEMHAELQPLEHDTGARSVDLVGGAQGVGAASAVGQSATTRSPGEAGTEQAKTGTLKMAIAAAVILLLTAAVFGARQLLKREPSFTLQNMQVARLTDRGKVKDVAISPDGRYVVYVLADGERESLWVRNVATKSDVQVLAPDALSFGGVSFSPDGNYVYFTRSGRNRTTYRYLYVMPVLGGAARQLIRDVDTRVSFSPDGRQLAFLRGVPEKHAMEIHVAGVDGTGDRVLVTLPTSPNRMGSFWTTPWSPNGDSIAVPWSETDKEMRNFLSVIRVADGAREDLYSGRDLVRGLAWLPDGRSLLVVFSLESEHRGQLFVVSYPSGTIRRFTNDLSSYFVVSLSKDAQKLVTLEMRATVHIWVVPHGHTAQARQITFGQTRDIFVAPGPADKLLLGNRGGEPSVMNRDGSGREPLMPAASLGSSMSNCADRYVVFDQFNGSKFELWRTDADGANAVKLADDAASPNCAPDGKTVLYTSWTANKLYVIPVAGGARTELTNNPMVFEPAYSPDGQLIEYGYAMLDDAPFKIAVIPSGGGSPLWDFQLPNGAGRLRWSPDQRGVQFVWTRNGATNVWEQLLAGGEPRQVTNFTSGEIADFCWSRDDLFLAKGESTRDAVLLSSFR
jgi:serine/threonine protein kinase/Tol biopolymer transport system component